MEMFLYICTYKLIPSNPAPKPTWSMPATNFIWFMCAAWKKKHSRALDTHFCRVYKFKGKHLIKNFAEDKIMFSELKQF